MQPSSGDITQLLGLLTKGDRTAEARLIPLVYDELRRLAQSMIRSERPDHTLQATALVHEVYLRLAGDAKVSWHDRAHFFAVAARTMRHILVDHARGLNAAKRRGVRIPLETALVYSAEQSAELLELDEALTRLAAWDERQSRIVELRFFSGLKEDEIAAVLGISIRTVKREWSMAKAWLYGELRKYDDPSAMASA
jgi:RNA polymerase sigma-70 factor (ECF subfamily)